MVYKEEKLMEDQKKNDWKNKILKEKEETS
jgi:hypothetical protein